jgi:2',3'-cyclic-nucleotide 2'-phosphodiesterase (5'-nucleotidase family)
MNRTIFTFLIVIIFSGSCSPIHTVSSLQYTDYRIEKPSSVDTGMLHFLQPYAASMNTTMNKVIGFTNESMNAKQPESALGNLLADCICTMAEKKFGKKVDAGFINQGGIRSYLPKGNITVGKIFEIMPFDNLVVIQQVKGSVFLEFLNKTAADGGWPVSAGIQLGIKEKKIVQALINGKPLDENATYTIANSDYVANGGSDCAMLKNIPKQDRGYLLRDAIIEYVSIFAQQGKPIEAKIENRVSYVN